MDTNKNKRTVLDLLDNAELELLQKDTEYAKQYLEEEGFNISEEQEFAAQFMKKIQFMTKALVNKKQDETLMEKALNRVKNLIAENVNQTSEALINLLHTKTPSIQYRKLENWSDDEIKDVLADIDLIEFMEELDKD
jgi:ABC-type iron transport system FetAB ATPase subunit